MAWLIIGSTATYHWFPDFRQPVDIDILTPTEVICKTPSQFLVDTQWHEVAEELIAQNSDPVFADPNTLFTLKVSHAHWDVKWKKTMYDISFLKRKGAQLNFGLYQKLLPVWERIHGSKSSVNLMRPLSEFFNDAVERKIDHELLHECVAFYERPLHEKIRPNHDIAWCSEDLFNKLSAEDQYKTALEEMMAVSIERGALTTKSRESDLSIAMKRAHFKLCTSMTKGWFARFLILNERELLLENKPIWMPQIKQSLLAISKLHAPFLTNSKI